MPLARFAAAAVAASAVAGSTLAADLGPPQYLAPLPVFSWTGFNIGIDGGFGGGVIDADTILFQPPIIIGGVTFSPGSVSTLHTSNRTVGFIVGGQVGYNYQLPNNIVVGIESDAQWSDVKESEHETAASTNPTLRFTDLRAGLDWFGTTRLRLGYARGRFLPYITGGISYGQVSGSQRVSGAPGTVFGSASSTHAG